MIYRNSHSGVFKIESDMNDNFKFKIGYRVDGTDKEVTFNYKKLPKEISAEFASVTNKIARLVEEGEVE
ncbi:hypothetical protein KM908_20460 [Alkalihalobacillus clausii]|uniref:hypothetical protein n=1 Tax=Shouchella clausii TaxID=79880 RepID=UPI001C21BF98|nr:hypothetical protein [Shouchella clausii]MBU8598488.1 hypothetical protein [Shouchella clausii]